MLWAMELEPSPRAAPCLRVLLFGGVSPAGCALALVLSEQENFLVRAPAGSTAEAFLGAQQFQPHVVLLDFHGLAVSTGHAIAFLKQGPLPPLVFVLTHDASPAMRRGCREARADAVFDKTLELGALRDALVQLASSMVSPATAP